MHATAVLVSQDDDGQCCVAHSSTSPANRETREWQCGIRCSAAPGQAHQRVVRANQPGRYRVSRSKHEQGERGAQDKADGGPASPAQTRGRRHVRDEPP